MASAIAHIQTRLRPRLLIYVIGLVLPFVAELNLGIACRLFEWFVHHLYVETRIGAGPWTRHTLEVQKLIALQLNDIVRIERGDYAGREAVVVLANESYVCTVELGQQLLSYPRTWLTLVQRNGEQV